MRNCSFSKDGPLLLGLAFWGLCSVQPGTFMFCSFIYQYLFQCPMRLGDAEFHSLLWRLDRHL